MLGRLVEPPLAPLPPDPFEFELAWEAPEGCPTREDVERRISALLPGAPTGDGVLAVEAVVTSRSDAFVLNLRSTFRGRTELREVRAHDCSNLGETTAVWLAIALEPGRAIAVSVPPEPPLVPPPGGDAAVPSPDPAPRFTDSDLRRGSTADRGLDPDVDRASANAVPSGRVEPAASGHSLGIASDVSSSGSGGGKHLASRRARKHGPRDYGLRIAGGLEAGALPPPAGAVQLAGLLVWPHARFEAHGLWLVPRTSVDAAGEGATYQLWAGGARGCGQPVVRAFEFPVCLGVEAGAVRAAPIGFANEEAIHVPWVAGLASAAVARAWGPIGLFAGIEGVVQMVGPEFFIGESTQLDPWTVSLRALVGFELRGSWNRRRSGQ